MRFILGFIVGLVLVSSSQAGIIRFVTYPVRHPKQMFHRSTSAAGSAATAAGNMATSTGKMVWKIVY
jgi:hypothetical protein